MTNPVVVTRPAKQAGALAEKIAATGRPVVTFPLLEILPLENDSALRAALSDLGRYAMLAFVSPNAIDAAFAVRTHWPNDMMFAVVGAGSRAALARHGITGDNARIVSPAPGGRTDSETLLEALDPDSLRGRHVLIVRGETGRELLADALRSAGAEVTQVAAYRRVMPALDASQRALLAQLIAAPHDWCISSSEALRNLLEFAAQLGGEAAIAQLRRQHLIVPHARIAESARSLGFCCVSLTGSGDDCIVAALQSRT